MVQKVAVKREVEADDWKTLSVNPAVNGDPFSNQGRIRQREERNGPRLSSVCPRYSGTPTTTALTAITVSTTRPEKCDIFAQLFSLNQLLQNSKNTAYIFLTFRNHVKIFLSQNILQNILNVVYRTTLSIRTERTDKQ